MPNAKAVPLHIFRAGKHTSAAGAVMDFSAADVATTAAIYDPAVSRAPLVVGHPTVDAPAYGWADRLTEQGGELFAEPAEVDAEFADMVNAGRFRNISVSLYPPDHAMNPKRGQGYYLKHIGFLGAQAPAVKGLKPAQFAADGEAGTVTVEFSAGDESPKALLRKLLSLFQSTPGESLRAPSFSASNDEVTTVPEATNTATAATQAALDARAAELATREAAFAARELTAAQSDATSFAEQLAKDGRILPTHKGAVVAALVALHGVVAVEFAEGDGKVTKTPADALRAVLSAKPAVVDFQRKTPEGGTSDGKAVSSFNAPAGFQVDAERDALHSSVLAYCAANKGTDYAAGLVAVEQQIAAARAGK